VGAAPGTEGDHGRERQSVEDDRGVGVTRDTRLPATKQAPQDARALLAAQLDESLTPEQRQVALLLVSELVTNAVRHTESDVIQVGVQTDGRVRVSVTDESPEMPRQQSLGPDEPGGRGLMIVDRLAQAWGVDRLPGDGKRIWVDLPDVG
jgi:anti-sigma regulatory factor (Ser/Thr protein kinase)